MIPRLVIASKNPDKIAEIEAVLDAVALADELVRGLDWPDIEETGDTLEANALLKGRGVAAATGLPVIADDTGLEVLALDGAPGVKTGRFAGPKASYEDNVDLLLERLHGVADRRARFVTVAALVMPDGVEVSATGFVDGEIALKPRGDRGFGYDPVFDIGGRTLAQMSDEEKNRLSHRARAIEALAEVLIL